MDGKVFGRKLQDLRLKRGLKVEEVAKYCNKTNGYIRTLESGSRLPSSVLLINICKCLNTTPNYLLGYTAGDELIGEKEILKRINMLTPSQKEVTSLLISAYLVYLNSNIPKKEVIQNEEIYNV